MAIGALDDTFKALATRPEQLEASGLTSRCVRKDIDPYAPPVFVAPPLKDPADEMALETAVNGTADSLVTFHLRHLAAAAREFGIRVGQPGNVLREIRRHEKK